MRRNIVFCMFLYLYLISTIYIGNIAYSEPVFKDGSLRAELIVKGLNSPTSMGFIDKDNILVLEKNTGEVRLIAHGSLLKKPVIKLEVEHTTLTCCRGLLGIAVTHLGTVINSENKTLVFLYYSEKLNNGEVRNRVYSYEWDGKSLFSPRLILDLPATPGPNHPGGKIVLGKDNYLYTVIGDLNNEGKLQNINDGDLIYDSSVILRLNSRDGTAAKDNPFIKFDNKMSKYYGYGIRNSFGLAIDPVTGTLWDTENGDKDYDEINLVKPGFNSGWKQLMGPSTKNKFSPDVLSNFPGSRYEDPVFSFSPSLGITALGFMNSTNLGEKYLNNLFVGDITHGNLYFFTLNKDRLGFSFDRNIEQELLDSSSDNEEELSKIVLGTGFGGITDIQNGPDGFLYILTFDQNAGGQGKIYRIVHS